MVRSRQKVRRRRLPSILQSVRPHAEEPAEIEQIVQESGRHGSRLSGDLTYITLLTCQVA